MENPAPPGIYKKLVNNRIGMNGLPTGTKFPTMNNIVLDSSPGDLYKMTRHTPCQSTILEEGPYEA